MNHSISSSDTLMDRKQQYCLSETPLHLELADALSETIERTQRIGVPLFLTGGVAASLISRDQWSEESRPLSRDLDFLIPNDPAIRACLEEEYGGAFKIHSGKAVFKSDKLQSIASLNGVELDFIACSNIVHPDATLSVTVTQTAVEHAGQENLFGVDVMTLPPALVAIQKLFAGRGADIGKFDLLDARSIIESGRVEPELLGLLIEELTTEATRMSVYARLESALAKLPPSSHLSPVYQVVLERVLGQRSGFVRTDISSALI